jgi:aminoglycoside/choline kinase family phosphotransferase/choline kinase
MKALILSAGLGSRLRPYTDHIPKPLFPVSGRPLLDRLIRQLVSAGCTAVAVNTYHLHHQIDAFLSTQSYGIHVFTRHEPVLLGTGGAIKNLSDFWDNQPFIVINSDILTDIDFGNVYEFHNRHTAPATLVLTDSPGLNSVSVDADETILKIHSTREITVSPDLITYTFTGIQVLDPSILPLIPEKTAFSSIDAYRKLIDLNLPPRAYMALSSRWTDIGTPDRYKTAARDAMVQDALQEAFGHTPADPIDWTHLDGDGSDRAWYRLQSGDVSLVAVNHGIKTSQKTFEIDSFVSIGGHLNGLGLPVPKLFRYDLFSGWVFMEDVGDIHLQTIIQQKNNTDFTRALYRKVLDVLLRFSATGSEGFDTAWTYQTAAYDAPLILERECAYFVNSFLRGYLGLDVDGRIFESAFRQLAHGALENAVIGLMHRDFQSRNIMIYHGQPRIIDFQGARLGPVQYDIASLLIDPYVDLSPSLQDELLDYAMDSLLIKRDFDPEGFRKCYEYCKVTRNLQILGAFGFLTRAKGKRHFDRYISPALRGLKKNLGQIDSPVISELRAFVEEIRLGDTDEKN